MSNAELLRKWGSENFLNQYKAADALGISQTYFSFLASGTRAPSLKIAARIEERTAAWSDGPIVAVHWIEENSSVESDAASLAPEAA